MDHTAFSLLGRNAKDVVTGEEGIVDSIAFDLYGCVQASFAPKRNDKGEFNAGRWLDIKRLRVQNKIPIMDVPNFYQPETGCADKPSR